MRFDVVGIRAENLRGYRSTYLPLDRPVSVLVGPNNSGKTSIFKLLDWALNGVDPNSCSSLCELSDDVCSLILPARETVHRARRLTLYVRISDGRAHRRFKCINGIALMRANVRVSPFPALYLALGQPTRGEAKESDPLATELLKKVQEGNRYIHVPSFRDAGSQQFKETLRSAIMGRISPKLLHHQQGGAPAEYRKAKNAIADLTSTLEKLAKPLWSDVASTLPNGLTRNASISLNCGAEEIVKYLSDQLVLRVSTGEHDSALVPLTELGSGLQSLLDLAVSRSGINDDQASTMLVVEEPESFLHPSAQRVVARSLLRDQSLSKLVVTTHSATVVDEARYNELVICKDHNFYFPKEEDADRDEINTAFLTGQGSEMLFSDSVLLVEGESDRLFFEALRRRLAANDSSGRMDRLFVVAVGGKKAFSPWIRILESYGSPSDRPIGWCVLADGDAHADVRRAFLDAGVSLAQSTVDALADVGLAAGDRDRWIKSIRTLNKQTLTDEVNIELAPIDLEYAVLHSCSKESIRTFHTAIGSTDNGLEKLLNKLGSKAYTATSQPVKAPWVRGLFGRTITRDEISADVKSVMARWASPIMSRSEFNAVFNALS